MLANASLLRNSLSGRSDLLATTVSDIVFRHGEGFMAKLTTSTCTFACPR
jgi:hypothetical protein